MEKPKYTLKTNEAVMQSPKQATWFKVIKIIALLLVAGILIGSVFAHKNLFMEMPIIVRILVVLFIVGVIVVSMRKKDTPSPMELQFYNNQLVLYRPMKVYSGQKARREMNTMKYTEITDCVYKTKSQRIDIYGSVKATWYQFYKNGQMAKSPTSDRYVKDTLLFFRTNFATDVDFKKEIEEHSPIRVRVENV